VRLGVLDIGSNTVHLLLVEAHHGAAPVATASNKLELRLAEHVEDDGAIDAQGIELLVEFVAESVAFAEEEGVETLIAFATSALREAPNGAKVLARLRRAAGVRVTVLSGELEARTTFLAVRRWFGWSSGELFVADIGGGSLELALGRDEDPDSCLSVPLGAGRLTWQFAVAEDELDLKEMRKYVRAHLLDIADQMPERTNGRHFVATSKSFRQLARINGAASSSAGPFVTRKLKRSDVVGMSTRLAELNVDERASLPGVSRGRALQLPAAAVVAEAVMEIFDIDTFELCPWALREGLILRYLDAMPLG